MTVLIRLSILLTFLTGSNLNHTLTEQNQDNLSSLGGSEKSSYNQFLENSKKGYKFSPDIKEIENTALLKNFKMYNPNKQETHLDASYDSDISELKATKLKFTTDIVDEWCQSSILNDLVATP